MALVLVMVLGGKTKPFWSVSGLVEEEATDNVCANGGCAARLLAIVP